MRELLIAVKRVNIVHSGVHNSAVVADYTRHYGLLRNGQQIEISEETFGAHAVKCTWNVERPRGGYGVDWHGLAGAALGWSYPVSATLPMVEVSRIIATGRLLS